MAYVEAEIKGKFIVIKIPICVLLEEYIIPDELLDDDYNPKFKVCDINEFSRDFVSELNKEGEYSSTPITNLLDSIYSKVVESGSLGVEENEN